MATTTKAKATGASENGQPDGLPPWTPGLILAVVLTAVGFFSLIALAASVIVPPL